MKVYLLTYGKSSNWLYEWNEMYNLRLWNVFMNSDKARVSGSENGFGPAYVSEQGFFDAPTAETWNICVNIQHFRKILSNYIYIHDGSPNFYLDLLQHTI